MASIYLINSPDGKKYIGSTILPLSRRLSGHRTCAKAGRPGKLYDAMRALGADYFTIEPLVACPIENRYQIEGEHIRAQNTHVDGLNKQIAGRSFIESKRAWNIENPERKRAQDAAYRARCKARQAITPLN